MATSENGYNLITPDQLDKSPIPGTNVVPVPGVQAGDIATILLHVGKLFNERVAPVYNPGCWGWNAPTAVPGTSIYSNHSSGTAIDLNAPSFPWKQRTMTPAQRQACKGIVAELEGAVRWGGDYDTVVDEMHFEINADEATLARVANKIRQGGNVMKDENDVRRAFQAVEHKQPTAKDISVWVGQPYEKYMDEAMRGNLWLTQNHFITYFPQNDQTIRSQEKTIKELQSQVGKDIDKQQLEAAFETLKKVLGK